jgi:sugar phosphate isomerase/epimerase
MKTGWIGFIYPPPPEITDTVDKLIWQMERAKEWGCTVLQPVAPLPQDDPAALKKIKDAMAQYDIEYEYRCPRDIFFLSTLKGDEQKKAIDSLQTEIDWVKNFGGKIMRCGYGALKLETTRWNLTPGKTKDDQLKMIVESLKIAAPMFEKAGIYFAQENHLDFSGKEIAGIFEEINSPNMGIALDTANGFGVLVDPNLDVEYMAPWAITSHIKDTKVIDEDRTEKKAAYFPMTPVGCPLGEGNLDIPKAVKLIAEKSRYPEGFHLIIEQGWFGSEAEKAGMGDYEYARYVLDKSIKYLQKLITV